MKRSLQIVEFLGRARPALAGLALALGAAVAAPLGAATVTVDVDNNLFSPSVVTIQVGDTVEWVNNSGSHNVVANDGSFNSGEPSFGWTYRRTFTTPGTVFYYCAPHVIFGMRGEIRVVAAPNSLTAPADLAVVGASRTEIELSWSDRATGETEYRVERAPLGGDFQPIATLPANRENFVAGGLDEETYYRFRVRAAGANGVFSPYSGEVGAATDAQITPCVAGTETLCVGTGGRFRIRVRWQTAEAEGAGTATPIASAPDSGLFYFFSPANLEMLVKVLDGCAVNRRFWVFYAATTDVGLTLTLVDTQTGKTRVYFNSRGQAAAPVQDVDAFDTCGPPPPG